MHDNVKWCGYVLIAADDMQVQEISTLVSTVVCKIV